MTRRIFLANQSDQGAASGETGLGLPSSAEEKSARSAPAISDKREQVEPAKGTLVDFTILVLGPVGLRAAGRHDSLGSAKERALLASLAIDVGRAISSETLIHRLWDEDPPAKPYASLHAYAARLRRRFRQMCDRPLIAQHAHTYTLDLAPDFIDFHRYHRLTAPPRELGAAQEKSTARRLGTLREAEALWRGEPLAGLAGTWAEEVRARLETKRVAIRIEQAALELRSGKFEEPAGELPLLLQRQPMNETIVEHLMTAYYGCGRQADALRLYADFRRQLREQLGTDPGEPLGRLHQLMLRKAPLEDILAPATQGATAPAPLNNLPAHADLIGRDQEIAALREPFPDGTVIAVESVSGMAGVGKSLLAFHAARALASTYPDGRLYVDLQAHSADRTPLAPSAALASLLRSLGLASQDIPHGLEERTSLWRSLLRERRTVVVLDDAAGPEQVQALLPLDSPSLVIVTSRQRLSGVPAVRPLFVDVLPQKDAVALFSRLAGAERAQDVDGTVRVVEMCGRLPLAIELAASRLRSRPAWSTRHLAQKLARSHSRLAEIRDRDAGVARAFELSYRTLTRQQQAAFRRLGLHFGHGFGTHAAAALIGEPIDEAERQLEALLDSNLLIEPAPERYRFHDLLGEYALTLARTDSREDTDAVRRLVEFYRAAALHADTRAHPRRTRLALTAALSFESLPDLSDAQEARDWLLTESPALITAEKEARTQGFPGTAAEMAHILAAFLDSEGLWDEAERMHRHAARHWHSQGAERAEALALIDLSVTHAHAARYEAAEAAVRRALRLARRTRDPECTAEALHQLGILHWHRAEYHKMLEVQSEALEIRIRTRDQWSQARSTNNMGIAHLHLGHYTTSFRFFQEALLAFREIGDTRGEAQALNNLADAHLHTGDRESARRFFSRVLEIAIESGSRSEQAMAQLNLGNSHVVPEEMSAALNLYEKALGSFQRLGDRRNETITRIALGNVLGEAAQHEEAADQHGRALALARDIGAGLEEAQALRGLGTAQHRLGRLERSQQFLEKSLDLTRRLQAPEEEARTLDAAAELLMTTGRPERAQELWSNAIGIFESLDASEAARIRARVLLVQVRREDPDRA
ncbi:tetratricopeptide repeat protein [Streptomyces diacarni]|uniref:AfsR/SARP family transcriptional regulator n=1 Tax=Streptomyces diacarni TaxID=2800381 RepID=UPI0033D62D44